jgi:hypothetical protein
MEQLWCGILREWVELAVNYCGTIKWGPAHPVVQVAHSGRK